MGVLVLSGFCDFSVPVADEGSQEWVFYTLVNPQVDGKMLEVIGGLRNMNVWYYFQYDFLFDSIKKKGMPDRIGF